MSLFHKVICLFGLLVSTISLADFKANEIIVKYADSTYRPRIEMNALYNLTGTTQVYHYTGSMIGFEQITLDGSLSVEEAVKIFEDSSIVEYAQPNYILRVTPDIEYPEAFPCIPGLNIPNCDPNKKIPCIPGLNIPGCDPTATFPCIFPGINFPPGCGTTSPKPPTPPTPGRPNVQDPPAEVIPPIVDPALVKAYGIAKIGATQAWGITKGSKDIIVGVIDTGIDYNHNDLSFNVWRNPNPTQGDKVGFDFIHNDGLPFDDHGHGTHCSGTIGAVGGNGIGVSGVNQRVSIMGLKFLSADGSGDTAGAIKAIDYAIEHGAKVLSNSWGGGAEEKNSALYDAIERAKLGGILFVVAAGNDGANNDGPNASYPAAYDNDNILAVAATDKTDTIAWFSNFGAISTDVGAPGVDIYSLAPNNGYAKMSGTSMACPYVAGAAALLWSKYPEWTYNEIKSRLMDTVDLVPTLTGKTVTGGRINVFKALQ